MAKDISELAQAGQEVESIPVSINYDIIRLFSEGLYSSPHKAIEELVCNSYDADADRVHVLLPEQPDDSSDALAPLWVIDNGDGMDQYGFSQLWRIADSEKIQQMTSSRDRLPIGQFGIGKLAAYVLAKQLIHISRKKNTLLLTVMDFNKIQGRYNDTANPVVISLREIDETIAKYYLSDIEHRDSEAWELLFGNENRDKSWTVAGLSDFRNLYNKLEKGRLQWVISTGLPLYTNFRVKLNGTNIDSSKERKPIIKEIGIDQEFEGIGKIIGTASIYKDPLTSGKSDKFGRSNGFFVRVRKRVINLEDPFFGLAKHENWQPNQSAWSRFALEIEVDGLQSHLLSSREGVKEDETIRALRKFLNEKFNQCRTFFDDWNKQNMEQIDVNALISGFPNTKIIDTLFQSAQITEAGKTNIYFVNSHEMSENEDPAEWLENCKKTISEEPFKQPELVNLGSHNLPLQYDIATRELLINNDHPFINKLTGNGKNLSSAKLFALSEVLLPGQLGNQGLSWDSVLNIMEEREEILRITAGETERSVSEVLKLLQHANNYPTTLEKATGAVFLILGFEYKELGKHAPGPDGELIANLGRQNGATANYTVIYDAKQTKDSSVSAQKTSLSSLEDMRMQHRADFGFFIATAYNAESNDSGKLNRQILDPKYKKLTLIKIEHLEELIKLHCKYGITLTRMKSLFEETNTTQSVTDWINELNDELNEQSNIPLEILLNDLEKAKSDILSIPNIKAVRAKNPILEKYEPERLFARLKAVETIVGSRWIHVGKKTYDVYMHQTDKQILNELEKQILIINNYPNEI